MNPLGKVFPSNDSFLAENGLQVKKNIHRKPGYY